MCDCVCSRDGLTRQTYFITLTQSLTQYHVITLGKLFIPRVQCFGSYNHYGATEKFVIYIFQFIVWKYVFVDLCGWLTDAMTSRAPGSTTSVTNILQDILAGVEWSLHQSKQLKNAAVSFLLFILFSYRTSHGPVVGTNLTRLMGTLKPQSNGPLYSDTVIGTLAVDGWAVTFGTAMRGLGGLQPRPVPSSLYQL